MALRTARAVRSGKNSRENPGEQRHDLDWTPKCKVSPIFIEKHILSSNLVRDYMEKQLKTFHKVTSIIWPLEVQPYSRTLEREFITGRERIFHTCTLHHGIPCCLKVLKLHFYARQHFKLVHFAVDWDMMTFIFCYNLQHVFQAIFDVRHWPRCKMP